MLGDGRRELVRLSIVADLTDAFPHSKTIAFEDGDGGRDHDFRPMTTAREMTARTISSRTAVEGECAAARVSRLGLIGFSGRLPRTATMSSFPRTYSLRPSSTMTSRPDPRLRDFGGFPTPLSLLKSLFRRFFPGATKSVTKTLTMPRTNTIGGKGARAPDGLEGSVDKEVPYITFAAVVGRNSRFEGLTAEQMDELGGVEYRALRVLLWIVTIVSRRSI